MIIVSLSAPTYDIDGNISFEIDPGGSEAESLSKRVTRTQNLDGSVTILDNGFCNGDRTITLTANLTRDQYNKINYLFRKYSYLTLTMPDGAYKVVLSETNYVWGEATLTFLVESSLTQYRPWTTTTTTSTSSSSSSTFSSTSSSSSTASSTSTQSSTSTSTSTFSSSSSSSSTASCDYNEFFTDGEKWLEEFQNNTTYAFSGGEVQFVDAAVAGGVQLLYKWALLQANFDVRVDITQNDGGGIAPHMVLAEDFGVYTNRYILKAYYSGGWKVYARARIGGVNQAISEVSDTCDKLRFVRSGTIFRAYYHKAGQWYLLDSQDFGADAANIKGVRLRADGSGLGASDTAKFDNLVFWGGCPDGSYFWTSTSSTQSSTSSSSSTQSSTSTSTSTFSTTSTSTSSSSSSTSTSSSSSSSTASSTSSSSSTQSSSSTSTSTESSTSTSTTTTGPP